MASQSAATPVAPALPVPPMAAVSPTSKVVSSASSSVTDSTEKDGVSSETSSINEKIGGVPELSSSQVEKALAWEGYLEDPMPEKVHGQWLRNVRYQILSLYRRFFGAIFITNALIAIVSLAKGGLPTAEVGKIVIGNLLVGILFRQDYVINTLFGIFCRLPLSYVCVFWDQDSSASDSFAFQLPPMASCDVG